MMLEFNKTGAAVNHTIGDEVLAFTEPDFIRISGAAMLQIDGFVDISGEFAFESSTDGGGASIIAVGATNVNATLGIPGSFGIAINGAELALILFGDGT